MKISFLAILFCLMASQVHSQTDKVYYIFDQNGLTTYKGEKGKAISDSINAANGLEFDEVKTRLFPFIDTLKSKFHQIVPYKLQSKECEMTVTFKVNQQGKVSNIKNSSTVDKYHLAVIVESLKARYSWQKKNENEMSTISGDINVKFPKMIVNINTKSTDGTKASNEAYDGNSTSADKLNFSQMLAMKRASLNMEKRLVLSEELRKYIKADFNASQMYKDTSLKADPIIARCTLDSIGNLESIQLLEGKDKVLNEYLMKMLSKYPDWYKQALKEKQMKVAYKITVRFPLVLVYCAIEDTSLKQ